MTLIVSIYDRVDLLPFFLRFYQERGIDRFVVALHNGEDNPLYWPILVHKKKYDLHVRASILCAKDQYSNAAETPGLNRIREEFVKPREWFAIADSDEFVICYQRLSFPQLAQIAEHERNCLGVHGNVIDRMASDGQFPPVDLKRSLDEQFPLALDITRTTGCNFNKVPLARGDVEILHGHHNISGMTWYRAVEVHHFKWTQGVQDRLRERQTAYYKQRAPGREEVTSFLRQTKNGVNLQEATYKIRPAVPVGV